MFYSQDILQIRGGRFAVVWLAATRGRYLSKRDYSRVNIRKTCDQIIDYIFVQASPKKHGGARPRLSLYLAAQLMYGTMRVYVKQQDMLFSDITSFLTKFYKVSATLLEIDLQTPLRFDLVTNPDVMALDIDPAFGELKERRDVSPQEFHDVTIWETYQGRDVTETSWMTVSPARAALPGLSLPTTPVLPLEPFKPETGTPHTVSSAEISLTEHVLDSEKTFEIPAELELPAFDDRALEMIAEEPMEHLPTVAPEHISASTPLYPPTTLDYAALQMFEETPVAEVSTVRVPDAPTRSRYVEPSPGDTVLEKSIKKKKPYLTMELTPITPSPIRRRKRKIFFADTEIQLSRDQLRSNLANTHDIIRHPSLNRAKLKEKQVGTVNDLMKNPARKELRHPAFFKLWKRNLIIKDFSETESDKERPIWTLPELRVRKTERSSESEEWEVEEMLLPEETTSPELLRQMEVSKESEKHERTPVSIEISKLSESLEETPSKRRKVHPKYSPLEEYKPLFEDRLVTHLDEELYALPEEAEVELPVSPEIPPIQEDRFTLSDEMLLRLLKRCTVDKQKQRTTFREICPPSLAPRHIAASLFTSVLNLCAKRIIKTAQEEPYGEIYLEKRD